MNKKVVSITSEFMGKGDDELGYILMQSFINTLNKQEDLPSAIVFYNSGVKLCTLDSPVIDSLQELVSKEVDLLICGTCAEFFEIKDKIGAGTVSNMYTILEILKSADSVITP